MCLRTCACCKTHNHVGADFPTGFADHRFTTAVQAIKVFEEVAWSDELRLDWNLRPGEIQLLSNHTCLHSREGFRDDLQVGWGWGGGGVGVGARCAERCMCGWVGGWGGVGGWVKAQGEEKRRRPVVCGRLCGPSCMLPLARPLAARGCPAPFCTSPTCPRPSPAVFPSLDHLPQDPSKQRHLLRLWLSPAEERPLPAGYADIMGGSLEVRRGWGVCASRSHCPCCATRPHLTQLLPPLFQLSLACPPCASPSPCTRAGGCTRRHCHQGHAAAGVCRPHRRPAPGALAAALALLSSSQHSEQQLPAQHRGRMLAPPQKPPAGRTYSSPRLGQQPEAQ